MPTVIGFLNPNPAPPSFLIPLLALRPGSNKNLIQLINSFGKIDAFVEFESGINCPFRDDPIERHVGEDAFWAFQLHAGDVLHGTEVELRKELHALLLRNVFEKTPLLQCEVAKFCNDAILYASLTRACFATLVANSSKIAAEIWRDTILLLPAVKAELGKKLTPDIIARNPSFSGIRVELHDHELVIEFPWHMFPPRSVSENLADLPNTLPLAEPFGIKQIAVRQSRWNSPPWFQQEKVNQFSFSPTGTSLLSRPGPVPVPEPGSVPVSRPVPVPVSNYPLRQLIINETVRPTLPGAKFKVECIEHLQRFGWEVRHTRIDVPAMIAAYKGRVAAIGFADASEHLDEAIAALRQIYPGFSRCILTDYYPTKKDQARCLKDRIAVLHRSKLIDLPDLITYR